MKVAFSQAARKDFEEIGDHIAKDNPHRAVTFVRELRAAALRVGHMPRAFPLLSHYERHGIRRRSWRDYLIFYRIEEGRITVVRILHAARDYEALLFPQP